MDAQTIAFQGEVMLLNWAESSTRGRTVTFLLDESTEAHPFKDCSIKSGKRAGQRFMAVLVEIGDDEQPVRQQSDAQLAAVLCKDPQFWHWASERSFDNVDSEEAARSWMLNLLQITSRSQIDKDTAVNQRFKLLVKVPFESYRQSLGGI